MQPLPSDSFPIVLICHSLLQSSERWNAPNTTSLTLPRWRSPVTRLAQQVVCTSKFGVLHASCVQILNSHVYALAIVELVIIVKSVERGDPDGNFTVKPVRCDQNAPSISAPFSKTSGNHARWRGMLHLSLVTMWMQEKSLVCLLCHN